MIGAITLAVVVLSSVALGYLTSQLQVSATVLGPWLRWKERQLDAMRAALDRGDLDAVHEMRREFVVDLAAYDAVVGVLYATHWPWTRAPYVRQDLTPKEGG